MSSWFAISNKIELDTKIRYAYSINTFRESGPRKKKKTITRKIRSFYHM